MRFVFFPIEFWSIFFFVKHKGIFKFHFPLFSLMSKSEKAVQEKLVAELQWWGEQSKRDYKGNPPPFENRKSRQSVEEEKEKVKSKLAASEGFLPFWHGAPKLSEDAVPLRHLRGSFYSSSSGRNAARRRTAGSESVAQCLNWVGNSKRSGQEVSLNRCKQFHSSSPIWDSHSISCMTPAERATAYREIILKSPKFTPSSVQIHHDRWCRESQLQRAA